MADVSGVRFEQIKDITDSLEALSCKSWRHSAFFGGVANIMPSTHFDPSPVLIGPEEAVGLHLSARDQQEERGCNIIAATPGSCES